MAALALLGVAGTGPAAAASLAEVQRFGSNPGNLRMFKYVPPSLPAAAPLVVVLHGCTQRAADAADAGWAELAQRIGFALLLPEQRAENNERLCFNWFNGWSVSDFWFWNEWGSDQDRDDGEALSIKQMIDRMKTDHGIDPGRVYVAGLSAGGAMTAVMLAAYPDVFAGGAIFAGVPYKCADTGVGALTQCGIDLTRSAARRIADLTPQRWAQRVRAASNHRGPWPRVSIWHGDSDRTVDPANARELVEQWTDVHGIDPVADGENRVKGHLHRVYRDAQDKTLVEWYVIGGMDHGVPVEPGAGGDKCGRPGAHSFAVGICANYYVAKFWGLIP